MKSVHNYFVRALLLYYIFFWLVGIQIWSNYFNLAVEFLTQPSLQLEKFTDVKREKIIEKYGDMRVLMGYQILNVWSKLGKRIRYEYIKNGSKWVYE